MTYYTLGEIFRQKLLLNHKGEPYTSKATISKALRGLSCIKKKTVFGIAKLYSSKQIEKWNNRW